MNSDDSSSGSESHHGGSQEEMTGSDSEVSDGGTKSKLLIPPKTEKRHRSESGSPVRRDSGTESDASSVSKHPSPERRQSQDSGASQEDSRGSGGSSITNSPVRSKVKQNRLSDSESDGSKPPSRKGSASPLSASSGSPPATSPKDSDSDSESAKGEDKSKNPIHDISKSGNSQSQPNSHGFTKQLDSTSNSSAEGSPAASPKSAKSIDSSGETKKKSSLQLQLLISDSESDDSIRDKPGSHLDNLKWNESESYHGSPKRSGSESGSDHGKVHDEDMENMVKTEEEETMPETRIDVEIPKITTDLGKSIHFVKLPNFLSVETRPFDPNTYEDEIDDEETLDEEGRARLKLKVENTIRWRERFNDKGVFVKESNARFVRWSDGSLSLHLGDEIFNVERQALMGDHNHLFIRQGTGLQGQAVFRTKLTFRPHSTESFTHRKMTMSLADRSTKTQGIKVLSIVGADPEANRYEMIKKEEDKLRASVRRENKQRRVRERASAKGLSVSYLDDEYSDEENSISIAAIKNRYKKGGARAHIYSSDEDDASDVEQGRRLEKVKRLKDSEDEDDGNEIPGPSSSTVGNNSGGINEPPTAIDAEGHSPMAEDD